jgi:hypothetical protein
VHAVQGVVQWVRGAFPHLYMSKCADASVNATQQFGMVGNWRYIVRSDGDGMFVVMRQNLPDDILEDEIAFCHSLEIAEVIVVAIVKHESQKRSAESRS